jgi:hypothetical protein
VVKDGIFKLLKSPGIDSKESIPPAYVSWRAGKTTLFLCELNFKETVRADEIGLRVVPIQKSWLGHQLDHRTYSGLTENWLYNLRKDVDVLNTWL